MSSRATFGTLKQIGAIVIAIAIVIAAGILVGQAPAIFGVEEQPEASITFDDQRGNGTSVTIQDVTLSDGGYVVITDGSDQPLAVSDRLEAGTHENVTIEREDGANRDLVGQLTATVHQDTSTQEGYAYEATDGEEDQPYLADGFPVSATATVLSGDSAVSNSFAVDSIDAPSSATTNETISVSARIRNPTTFQAQQPVEVRIGGAVFARQVFELESGEVRNVTFEVETNGAPAGNQSIGVYTEDDGELGQIDLEFHTDPVVAVEAASNDSVTVSAATPAEGFVALERNGTILGTSERLDPGEHGNVTIDLPADTSIAADDELTATLYAGTPGNVDAATPIESSGETVQTVFTFGAVADEPGDGEA